MKNKTMIRLLTLLMAMIMVFGALTGCSNGSTEETSTFGTIVLKVNPEFEIDYDNAGNVLALMPMNEDAAGLMEKYEGYQARPTKEVVAELIGMMHEAGFINGENDGKDINLEVKYGSAMPEEKFLVDIVTELKTVFDDKLVMGKVVVTGESNYGISEYDISDYGNTDYKEAKTKINEAVAGGESYTDYADTDYDGHNSDYDADTDYDGANTDYDSNYDDSNYGNNKTTTSSKPSTSKPVTSSKPSTSKPATSSKPSVSNSDYDSNYDNNSNYNDSDYGNSNPSTSKPATSNKPSISNSNYDSDSSYDNSNYDSDSSYDNSNYDSDSFYDNSDYDD